MQIALACVVWCVWVYYGVQLMGALKPAQGAGEWAQAQSHHCAMPCTRGKPGDVASLEQTTQNMGLMEPSFSLSSYETKFSQPCTALGACNGSHLNQECASWKSHESSMVFWASAVDQLPSSDIKQMWSSRGLTGQINHVCFWKVRHTRFVTASLIWRLKVRVWWVIVAYANVVMMTVIVNHEWTSRSLEGWHVYHRLLHMSRAV